MSLASKINKKFEEILDDKELKALSVEATKDSSTSYKCPACGATGKKNDLITVAKDAAGKPDSSKATCNKCGKTFKEVSFWNTKKKESLSDANPGKGKTTEVPKNESADDIDYDSGNGISVVAIDVKKEKDDPNYDSNTFFNLKWPNKASQFAKDLRKLADFIDRYKSGSRFEVSLD